MLLNQAMADEVLHCLALLTFPAVSLTIPNPYPVS